jgi:hypothetical protein
MFDYVRDVGAKCPYCTLKGLKILPQIGSSNGLL